MIDEKKMQRELKGLVDEAPEGSPERKIYSVLLEYINRQPVITLAQMKFELRMRAVYMAAVQLNVGYK